MKTFDEWSKAGYKINKGSKGTKGLDGKYWFNEQQVTYSPRRSYSNSTFKGCTPKGTAQMWGDFDEEEDDMSNPMFYDYRGFGY